MTTEPAAPATCRACGARVRPAVTPDGNSVALEIYTEPSGAGRYRVIATTPGQPLLVEPVNDLRPVDAFPDHSLDCPGGRNGLGR